MIQVTSKPGQRRLLTRAKPGPAARPGRPPRRRASAPPRGAGPAGSGARTPRRSAAARASGAPRRVPRRAAGEQGLLYPADVPLPRRATSAPEAGATPVRPDRPSPSSSHPCACLEEGGGRALFPGLGPSRPLAWASGSRVEAPAPPSGALLGRDANERRRRRGSEAALARDPAGGLEGPPPPPAGSRRSDWRAECARGTDLGLQGLARFSLSISLVLALLTFMSGFACAPSGLARLGVRGLARY